MVDDRVTIAGAGKVTGGVYESVRIAGSGKIDGDVEAKTITTAGSCKIEGNAKAEEFSTAGTCKVTGAVAAGEMKTAGVCTVSGDVTADLFKCSGSQKIGGRLSANYARIAGHCEVGGDVEADKFLSEGAFQIGGLLSADEIDIRLGGNCHASEIGGERIRVRRRHEGHGGMSQESKLKHGLEQVGEKLDRFGERFGIEINIDSERLSQELSRLGERIRIDFGGSGVLTTDLIEGDEIDLSWTEAGLVRGKRVKIGKGCRIKRVEYSESLEVAAEGEVAERSEL